MKIYRSTATVHVMTDVLMPSVDCIYLGDPRNPYSLVLVRVVTQESVAFAENGGTSPEWLAVNLLMAIFTPDQLKMGKCTKPRMTGIIQLDRTKIQAIRGTHT